VGAYFQALAKRPSVAQAFRDEAAAYTQEKQRHAAN